MFSIFKEYDPEIHFILPEVHHLEKIAQDFGYENEENILNIWIYYNTLCQMRYVSLFKDLYPLPQIVRNVIVLAIESYKD